MAPKRAGVRRPAAAVVRLRRPAARASEEDAERQIVPKVQSFADVDARKVAGMKALILREEGQSGRARERDEK